MSQMIEGISPLSISRIVLNRFARYGYHPLHDRLLDNKKPWLRFIPFSWGFAYRASPDDWPRAARITIIGHNDTVLKYITCKSNDEMYARADAAQEKLDNFLANIQGKGLKQQ